MNVEQGTPINDLRSSRKKHHLPAVRQELQALHKKHQITSTRSKAPNYKHQITNK